MCWGPALPNPRSVFFQKSPVNLGSGSEFPVDKLKFILKYPALKPEKGI